MGQAYAIAGLEVVAFANRLESSMVPTVVAPIFRVPGNPPGILFPPFRFEAGKIVGGTFSPLEELGDWESRGKITKLEKTFSAHWGCELWVDEHMVPHYEPARDAAKKLRAIAQDAAKKARQALLEGQWAEAARCLGTAFSADDRLLDSLVYAAALAEIRNNEARVALMREAAEGLGLFDTFNDALQRIREAIPPGPVRDNKVRPSKLTAMAAKKEALAA